MRTTDLPQGATEATAAVAAATAGDEAAFGALVERYRPELQVHCYRMLGSLEDSEDVVQETFLRAWRRRATYAGRSTFRAWLYRIATNACLDHLERHPRRPPARAATASAPRGAVPEVPWLQPYPDRLLEGIPAAETEPAAAVAAATAALASVARCGRSVVRIGALLDSGSSGLRRRPARKVIADGAHPRSIAGHAPVPPPGEPFRSGVNIECPSTPTSWSRASISSRPTAIG